MSHDEYTKLFAYIQAMRAEMNAKFDAHDRRFDRLEGTCVDLGVQIKENHQEFQMFAHRAETRLEPLVYAIAMKTGVSLPLA